MQGTIYLENGKELEFELYKEIAPKTVDNFIKLVNNNYYDGVIFHRVISNFMIQTGGYVIKDNTINYNKETETIIGEFKSNGVKNDLKHTLGVMSMARTQVKNSASGQFFICVATTPHLDGEYAAFGKITNKEGIDEIIRISNVQTTTVSYLADFPVEPILIKTIKLK